MRVTSIISQLQADYPEFTFCVDETYSWSPRERRIYYIDNTDTAQLFHELGHAILGHRDYGFDIALLEMERDAWSEARRCAKKYGVVISSSIVEDSLDTYRDWLHARSTCPNCHTTGLQIKVAQYNCLACDTTWRVNDARTCGLRRSVIKK